MEKETRASSEVDVDYELTVLECEVEVCKMVLRKSVRRAETVFGGHPAALESVIRCGENKGNAVQCSWSSVCACLPPSKRKYSLPCSSGNMFSFPFRLRRKTSTQAMWCNCIP